MSVDYLNPLVFNGAGIAGVVLYVLGYALLQFGVIRGRSYAYIGLNLAAPILILVSLIGAFNLYSAAVQVSWITISLVGLWRVWKANRALRFTSEESALLAARFPLMAPLQARAFLDTGRWRAVAGGEILSRQGAVLDRLIFLATGAVRIEVGEAKLADVSPPAFLGELTVLSGGPATATARAMVPSRIFEISGGNLRRLVQADPEIGPHLDAAMRGDMAEKLSAANKRLANPPGD